MKTYEGTKMQLMENSFLTISHEEDPSALILVWSTNTAHMTDADFKYSLIKTAEYAEQYKPHGLMVDVRNFQFGKAMGPELAKWRAENIIPRYNKAGVKRFAFIHGKEFPEKSGDGERSAGEEFFTQHFASEERAKQWVKS